MSQQEASDSHLSKWLESSAPRDDDLEIVRLSAARTRAMDEAGAAIARQLNGPLTALLLYMGEIKQHSHQFSQGSGDRAYLQQVVENALQQTERVCAMMKQIAGAHEGSVAASGRKAQWETRSASVREAARIPGVMFSSGPGQKPLTKGEREVLSLISEGCSNKQGALRMRISPRTFESHRAEAMRKLGARNTRRSRPHRALAFGFGVAERVTIEGVCPSTRSLQIWL
jgi:DNA-binding CsgD family transcriptional regulator